jgi:hypothetical protein
VENQKSVITVEGMVTKRASAGIFTPSSDLPTWWGEKQAKNPKGERKGYAAQTEKKDGEKAKGEPTREEKKVIRAKVSSLLA